MTLRTIEVRFLVETPDPKEYKKELIEQLCYECGEETRGDREQGWEPLGTTQNVGGHVLSINGIKVADRDPEMDD